MKHKVKNYLLIILLIFLIINCLNTPSDNSSESSNNGGNDNNKNRNDNAIRLTVSNGITSNQNPAFSQDGKYIIYTCFLNGYNIGPSQVMKLNIETGEKTVLFSSIDADNVNVPGTSWIGNLICWSSDRAGDSDEIYIANDDGSSIVQITDHPESIGYYIEPVFNPQNTNKIIFEHGPSDIDPHKLALVEIDQGDKVTYLTGGAIYDDRLPNWSHDGTAVLFQRADAGNDNWQIYTATINYSGIDPVLENITKLTQPAAHNTDNSWYSDNSHILSSSDYDIEIPNIYAFPIDGSEPIRITFSDNYEDGAPSCSYDGKWIVFESHIGQDEDTPSDIWIIKTPEF